MAILEKIRSIRDTLAIEKTGFDERQGYAYFKADDVATGVRAALVQHGVIHKTELVTLDVDNGVDGQGRSRPRVTGQYRITFIDTEDGSEFSTEAVATGSDIGGDKGTRKAAVQAFKIACIDIFTIVEGMSGMDSDSYAPEETSEKSEGEPKGKSSKELGAQLTELINDPAYENITGESAMKLGQEVANEILEGVQPARVWKKDARVLEELIKRLLAGEVA